MHLVYSVTAHGLGHWTRSEALIEALMDEDPDLVVTVSTGLPEVTVRASLGGRVRHRTGSYEPGASQHNCLDVDVAGTANAYVAYEQERTMDLDRERTFLRTTGADAVISDISALAVRAGADLGLPTFGVANFTWDWLLESMLAETRVAHLPALFAEDYRRGTAHWLLPFGQTESPFPTVHRAPILARQARNTANATRQALGLPAVRARGARPVVLVCVGGWQGRDLPPIRLRGLNRLQMLVVGDLALETDGPILRLPHRLPASVSFPDLVNMADAIVTKPGYGMASEATVHGTPIAFVNRTGFRETPAILAAMGEHPTHVMMRRTFAEGSWREAIDTLLSARRPIPPPVGTARIARELLSAIHSA